MTTLAVAAHGPGHSRKSHMPRLVKSSCFLWFPQKTVHPEALHWISEKIFKILNFVNVVLNQFSQLSH